MTQLPCWKSVHIVHVVTVWLILPFLPVTSCHTTILETVASYNYSRRSYIQLLEYESQLRSTTRVTVTNSLWNLNCYSNHESKQQNLQIIQVDSTSHFSASYKEISVNLRSLYLFFVSDPLFCAFLLGAATAYFLLGAATAYSTSPFLSFYSIHVLSDYFCKPLWSSSFSGSSIFSPFYPHGPQLVVILLPHLLRMYCFSDGLILDFTWSCNSHCKPKNSQLTYFQFSIQFMLPLFTPHNSLADNLLPHSVLDIFMH